MAHANASIGTTNYSVAITAGHYPLNAHTGRKTGRRRGVEEAEMTRATEIIIVVLVALGAAERLRARRQRK